MRHTIHAAERLDAMDPKNGFAQALLSLVERTLVPLEPPAVRALHLPASFTPGAKDGEFCALELTDGSIGLSFALLGDTSEGLRDPALARDLQGQAAIELARGFVAGDARDRAIGMAAINALSQHLFRRAGYQPSGASDSIGLIAPRPGERIGMVGLFPPLTRRILDAGASLVVVELNPALAGVRDGFTVTLDHTELSRCDKVLSTTTLMLNDTVDDVIAACAGARELVMIGPGGGCLPDALFERGVSALGGTAIVDRDGFVRALAQGESWGAHARKTLIRRDDYPGASVLLARALARVSADEA